MFYVITTRLRNFFFSLIVCSIFNASTVAKPSIDDYGALPQITKVSLSPSGDLVAFRKVENGGDFVVIVSRQDQKVVGVVNVSKITPRDIYFVSESELILVASTFTRIHGFWGRHDVSTAFVYNLNHNKIKPLLELDGDVYPGQTGLGKIVGISPDHQWVYMPAYTGKRSISDPNYSLLKVKLASPKIPRTHTKGDPNITDFFVDQRGEVLVQESYDNEKDEHRLLVKADGKWNEIYYKKTPIMEISVVGLTPDRKRLVILDEDSKTGRTAYFTMSLADGSLSDAQFAEQGADVEQVITDINRVVYGIRYSGLNPSYKFFDDKLNARVANILAQFPGASVWLRDWTPDWRSLVVYVEGPHFAGQFFLFTQGQDPAILSSARQDIKNEDVNPLATYNVKARDGLLIPNILTIPKNKVESMKKLPTVVRPHGGPESYNQVEFDWLNQALASEGYLVVQPQFRGSSGFGPDHLQAGYGQWGKKMQDDLTDSLASLVRKGIVDPERVCILGWSYGGYAALAGGAFTPELYKCVVSINGVSDLEKMLAYERREHGKKNWVVTYFEQIIAKGEADNAYLRSISPARFARNFTASVLLIHGEDDKIVPIKQSKYMNKSLKKADKRVQFLSLEDDNHSLLQGETRMEAARAVVKFINRHLKGEK